MRLFPSRFLVLGTLLFQPALTIADPLHQAAFEGDIETVQNLLDQGADVNAPDPSGPPLVWALFAQNESVAQLLIAHGADPNAMGMSGSVLFSAVTFDMQEVIRALLEQGADPNTIDDNIPLIAAVVTGNTSVVEMLLSHGADATASKINGISSLHEAARQGHLEIARALLEHGADVNALTDVGWPPIHYAKLHRNYEIADLLEKNGSAPRPVEAISDLIAGADLAEGAKEAERCFNCHTDVPGAVGRYGPSLWNLIDRPRGSLPAFEYSSAFDGIEGVWSYDALNRYLARPAEYIPGTEMDIGGILEPQRRANLIAYLRTLSDNPAPLP